MIFDWLTTADRSLVLHLARGGTTVRFSTPSTMATVEKPVRVLNFDVPQQAGVAESGGTVYFK